jgi:hypothetical protein
VAIPKTTGADTEPEPSVTLGASFHNHFSMHLGAALLQHPLPIGPLLSVPKLKHDLALLSLDNDLNFLETTRVTLEKPS